MPTKFSNNLNSHNSNNRAGVNKSSKPTSERTTHKHNAVNNPVPGKGGKKNK